MLRHDMTQVGKPGIWTGSQVELPKHINNYLDTDSYLEGGR